MIDHTTVPLGRWRPSCAELHAAGLTVFDLLTAVDQLDDSASPGIDLVLHVRRPDRTEEAWLRTRWHEGLTVRSIADIWPGARWREQELREMFGVLVEGTPTDQPLLLPEGFEGTPLRSSFVLAARVATPWPGAARKGERGGARFQPAGRPGPEWGPR